MPYSVLFVCLGNICRSPTAEGVFRKLVEESGLQEKVIIDSAGTSAYHIGESPDSRSQAEALRHGYDLSPIRSRQIIADDFDTFDVIIAMDKSNLEHLKLIKSKGYEEKLKLFLYDFAPHLQRFDVPDPYYGGPRGFTEVVELIEQASQGLLDYIEKRLAS